MKTRKVLSVILVMSIAVGMFGTIGAFAAAPPPAEGEKVITLYKNDFEDNTVGAAPNLKTSDGTTSVSTSNGVVRKDSTSENKYAEIMSATNNILVMNFDNELRAASGKVKVEFDINLLGDKDNKSFPKASLVPQYKTYKYFMYMSSNVNTDGKQKSGTTSNGSTYTELPDSASGNTFVERNKWQHFSYTIDIDKGTVQLTVSDLDGTKKSESEVTVNTGMSSASFRAMAFVAGGKASFYIDNIEIYNIVSDSNVIFSDNFEGNEVGATPAGWLGGFVSSMDKTYTDIKQGTDDANKTKYLSLQYIGGKGDIARKIFNQNGISSGKLYISLDAKTKDGSPRLFLVAKGKETASAGKMIGLWNASNKYLGKVTHEGSTVNFPPYKDSKGDALAIENDVWYNYKFTVDLDKKAVSAAIYDMSGALVKQSAESFDFDYLNDISVCGIGLRPMTASSFAVDNVVVSADKTAIESIATGSNRAKISFVGAVGNITKEDVTVQRVITKKGTANEEEYNIVSFEDAAIKNVEKLSGTEYIVEFEGEAEENGDYMVTLADGVKYADGTEIMSKSKRFVYNNAEISATVRFSSVPSTVGAAGQGAVAEYILTGNLSECNATLYIVTYDADGKMLECSIKPITFTKSMSGAQGKAYHGFAPTREYSQMKAFIWTDDAIVPIVTTAAELNAAAVTE